LNKSPWGKSLNKARVQATDYYLTLKDHERPRYILLSDFQNFEPLHIGKPMKRTFLP
jgi:hypothetical protein